MTLSPDRLRISKHRRTEPVLRRLVEELDDELREKYPSESIHGLSREPLTVLVAWLDGRPVGCGMLTPLASGACEIKRMFVTRGARGQGIGGDLLRALESVAQDDGFRVARLETGAMQPESIALYEINRYARIPCFEEYVSDPRSLCFEKILRT